MGNVYRYCECEHCQKVTDAEYTFIVHRDPTHITNMEDKGYPPGKIAAHFCGYCGGYLDIMSIKELFNDSCSCGHFQYQGWNYEDSDPLHWEEPKDWLAE